MAWTTEADITASVEKLWRGGKLPAAMLRGDALFPLSIKLKGPSEREAVSEMDAVRRWSAALSARSKERLGAGYRVVTRRRRSPILGENDMPERAVIESFEDAIALISKKKEARLLEKMADETAERLPALLAFIERYPIRALSEAADWPRYVDVCLRVLEAQRPGIYLREFDLPSIHTKFIKTHYKILSELLDLSLPASAVDTACPASDFEGRYGFRRLPVLVRMRLPLGASLFPNGVTDISMTAEEFAACDIPCDSVLVLENLVTFLAVPRDVGRLIIWGAGYCFEHLSAARWLREKKIYYWGDIDTHGLAILSEFRGHFPQAVSLLMDEETLLAHRHLWAEEAKQAPSVPDRLTPAEAALFDALKSGRFGLKPRLEQERIGMAEASAILSKI